METIFPTHQGFSGMFVPGFRKAGGATQRTGTVILKRTYNVNGTTGTLTPAAALPVFVQDQPFNLLANSDFEQVSEGKPSDWEAEAGLLITTELANDPNHRLKVSNKANGRVTQKLTFEEPLGGRQFVFTFEAYSDTAAAIQNVQLEAEGRTLCVLNANLNTVPTRFSAVGTWPTDVQGKEMLVVLRMATQNARTVFYDKVQVEEASYQTVWASDTTLRYEHDLAAFKPEGDMIVVGYTDVIGLNRILVNGSVWFSHNVISVSPRKKALAGWELRAVGPRKVDAGTFPSDPNAYPLSDPLPSDFNNRFYNGYPRSAAQAAPFSYLSSNAQVTIERTGSVTYRVHLRAEQVNASYFYYAGVGEDEQANWRREAVGMQLDTLVIEPERNRCYSVWRGAWPFNNHPEASYRQLVVSGSP